MRKTLIIARREYMAAVRTKAFLIGLLSMPVMMFGSIGVQLALRNQVDTADKRYAVVDRTPGAQVAAVLTAAAAQRNATQIFDPQTKKQTSPRYLIEPVAPSADDSKSIAEQRLELSDRVRKGELAGFLEIGANVLKPPTGPPPALDARGQPIKVADDPDAIRYQTNSPLQIEFPRWAEQTATRMIALQRLSELKITMDSLLKLQPVQLVSKKLTVVDPKTHAISDAPDEERITSFLAPAAMAILMMMMVLVSSTPLMQSVFEEKTARIAEVLLGSVSPFEIMMGKLLGMVGVSLTTVSLYLAGGYFAAVRYGFGEYLTPVLIGWFLVYQTVSVLMYGSLFIAIGAACTDIKESQSLMTPVMLLVMIPMFTLTTIIERPNGPLATGLSFFPFATPMIMIIRQSIPPGVPWWQPVLGIGGMLAMSVVCVYAAGRILRVGLLSQGKGANFAQMARWVIKG